MPRRDIFTNTSLDIALCQGMNKQVLNRDGMEEGHEQGWNVSFQQPCSQSPVQKKGSTHLQRSPFSFCWGFLQTGISSLPSFSPSPFSSHLWSP